MAVIPRASVQPTRLVPLSGRNSLTGPRIEVKRLRAFINEEELIQNCFKVAGPDRNYLRFVWYAGNSISLILSLSTE